MLLETENLRIPIEYFQKTQDPHSREIIYSTAFIEIKPFSDINIASLPLQERAKIVKERQISYWRPLLIQEYSELYKSGRQDSTRLLETLFDVNYRNWEINNYSEQLRRQRRDFDMEKSAIKKSSVGKFRQKKLKDLLETNKQREIDITSQKNASSILRDTALAVYLKEAILTPDANDRLSVSIEDIKAHTNYDEKSILDLLTFTTRHINQIYTADYIEFLNYKSNGKKFTRDPDAAVLLGLISFANGETGQNKLDKSLGTLSQNLLNLYWKNLIHLFPKEEQTPVIAFAHDYFFAAAQTQNINQFIERSHWILSQLKNSRAQLRKELDYSYQEKLHEEIKLQQLIYKIFSVEGESGKSFNDYLSSPPDNFIPKIVENMASDIVIGQNFDRLHGLELAMKLLSERDKTTLFTDFNSANLKWMIPGKDLAVFMTYQWKHILSAAKGNISLYDLVVLHAEKTDYHKQAEEFAQHPILGKLEKLGDDFLDLAQKKTHLSTLREKFSDTSHHKLLISSALLHALFMESSPSSTAEMKTLILENEDLLKKIRYENIWFVAKNGDQFSANLNPDLAQLDISSVTFFPEQETKGGHSVEIVSFHKNKRGYNHSITILIDRQGKIYFPTTPGTALPHWLYSKVQNFLLARINFITSGALAVRDQLTPPQEGSEKDSEIELIARRSHYRYLTSTQGKTYTLQSPEARKHAEYVLNVYGIDIYEENLRRRRAGTLKPNQVITFVKEVDKGYAPPNQLAFDRNFAGTLSG